MSDDPAPAKPLPDGVPSEGRHVATLRHWTCRYCGRGNEVRLVGFVPSAYYNAVAEYVRAAAGNEFVLLPVATVNAMGEERERLANELRELRDHP